MTAHILGLVIGIIIAIPGTIMPVRKFLSLRSEKTFFSLTLIPIALFYIGFSYYYGDLTALHAEIVGVIIFTVLALLAQFMASWILVIAYVAHGAWDVLHEVYIASIGGVIPWTEVPAGYAAFCLAYDLIIAVYVYKRMRLWDEAGSGQ
jgi:hypothetical protein